MPAAPYSPTSTASRAAFHSASYDLGSTLDGFLIVVQRAGRVQRRVVTVAHGDVLGGRLRGSERGNAAIASAATASARRGGTRDRSMGRSPGCR